MYTVKKALIPPDLKFSVYPNPSNGKFRFNASPVIGSGSKIMVYDASGRSIFSKLIDNNTSEINLGDVPSGSYSVKIMNHTTAATTHFNIVR
jgi:hypothetical protein